MSARPTESPPVELAEIDLTRRELYSNGFPHEVFNTLRREAPVWWQRLPEGSDHSNDPGFWVLSRYEDVQA